VSVVLIVEDEILEQEFLQSIAMEELGPEDEVYAAESGMQAVSLAKQHKPDFIFMDIMIPEMDGLSTIAEIRKFLPDACITILSSCSDFAYAQKALKLRVFEYLLKPVKPKDFKEVFRRMLDSASDRTLAPEKANIKTIETKECREHFIEESVKYIKEHFKERLSLDMVAAKAFMNPKYFSHVFKREMGVSFTEYVINLKVQYACRLLETTNYPAYRISLECGFSDPSYFNRVFCAQMNMTPQTYRKYACSSKQKTAN
jgi:YesN/AraC family two-component response regulator